MSHIRMSVVVPVYNKGRYLRDCMRSLAAQTISPSSFEVILVDDGSTDDSLRTCFSLAGRYPFIRVLAQAHGGVSVARNTAIAHAQGDYIMFLDADDRVNREAIESLVAAFDRFSESVDVVTYRLAYYYPASGATRYHRREEWLTRTGVYPLRSYPFIAQSTMNVCIRNRRSSNILFDERLAMGEDQLFVAENLMGKAAIGYCKEAVYTYTRDGSSASRQRNNPLYSFGDMILLYRRLIRMAEAEPAMSSYLYQLVLYNFDWRLRSNMLFPSSAEQRGCDPMMQELEGVARSIPGAEYADSPYLSSCGKALLAKRFGLASPGASWVCSSGEATLRLSDGSSLRESRTEVVFERCRVEGDVLAVRCRIVSPVVLFGEAPSVAVTCNGKQVEAQLGGSSFDGVDSLWGPDAALALTFSLDLREERHVEVEIAVRVDGEELPQVEVTLAPALHNGRLAHGKLCAGGYEMAPSAGGFTVRRASARRGPIFVAEAVADPKALARRLAIASFSRNHRFRIWLYVDPPFGGPACNALHQMLADSGRGDGITRYYVTGHPGEVAARHPELSGSLVEYRSRTHAFLALRAELVISSHHERSAFMPMRQSSYDRVADLGVAQRRIYIPDGISIAHAPQLFSYDRLQCDYAVVSTRFERENLESAYCFPAESLLATGAPCFDACPEANEANGEANTVVYLPSWRSYLDPGAYGDASDAEKSFRASSFYRGAAAFVELVGESGVLERHDLRFGLQLDPRFQCYSRLFDLSDSRMHLVDPDSPEPHCGLVVTDFSPHFASYAYAGAGVVRFLPDHVELYAGLGSFGGFDVDLGHGDAPCCVTAQEAFEALAARVGGAAGIRGADVGRERPDFFFHRDGNNRERLYCELKRIADSLG